MFLRGISDVISPQGALLHDHRSLSGLGPGQGIGRGACLGLTDLVGSEEEFLQAALLWVATVDALVLVLITALAAHVLAAGTVTEDVVLARAAC